MRICYAECPYNCMDDDFDWSDTVNMFCSHPNNDSAECVMNDLFYIANFKTIGQLLFYGAILKEWVDFDDYMELTLNKGNCRFVKHEYADSDVLKHSPGEKVIINERGDWVYELDAV